MSDNLNGWTKGPPPEDGQIWRGGWKDGCTEPVKHALGLWWHAYESPPSVALDPTWTKVNAPHWHRPYVTGEDVPPVPDEWALPHNWWEWKNQQGRWSAVVKGSGDGYARVDADGNLDVANEATEFFVSLGWDELTTVRDLVLARNEREGE